MFRMLFSKERHNLTQLLYVIAVIDCLYNSFFFNCNSQHKLVSKLCKCIEAITHNYYNSTTKLSLYKNTKATKQNTKENLL